MSDQADRSVDQLLQEDVNLLRSVASLWDELSYNQKAYHAMTDHCHIELSELEMLACKIERIINRRIP